MLQASAGSFGTHFLWSASAGYNRGMWNVGRWLKARPALAGIFLLVPLALESGCNPAIRRVALSSRNLSTSPSPAATPGPFTFSWDFSDSSHYSASSSLTLSPNSCALNSRDFLDDDASASGFGGTSVAVGAVAGTLSDSSIGMKLGLAGGCDSAAYNCNELDTDWMPKADKLYAVWHLNGSGAIANNATVSPSATPSGAPILTAKNANGSGMSYVAGKSRTAIQFDGTDDHLDGGTPVHAFNQGFALSFWFIKGDALADSGLIASGGVNSDGFIAMMTGAGGGTLFSRVHTPSGQVDINHAVTRNRWHHLVITWDDVSQTARFYFDSAEIGSGVLAGPVTFATLHPFLVGKTVEVATTYLDGQVDEIAIWDDHLTAADVKSIYEHQRADRAGRFTSRILDAASSQTWTELDWTSLLPTHKPLPDAGASETSSTYPSLVGSTGSTSDNNLMSGIVALYHLDETAYDTAPGGYDFADSSGNGNHLNLVAGPPALGAIAPFNSGVDFYTTSGRAVNVATPTVSGAFTVSAWAKAAYLTGPDQAFIGMRAGADNTFDLKFVSGGTGFQTNVGNGSSWLANSTFAYPCSADTWYHVVVTATGSGIKMFVNGVQIGSASYSGTPLLMDPARPLTIGSFSAFGGEAFYGFLDEVAVWSRALHDTEVAQLYQRGATRIRFQVRRCTTAGCADDPLGEKWQGPDGTAQTFFSELYSRSSQAAAPSGSFLESGPRMLFSNFGSVNATGRYFQYRTLMEAEAGSFSPELRQVAVGPMLDSAGGTVQAVTGRAFTTLSGFSASASCSSGVVYTLSVNQTLWYWWNGSAWAISDGTAAQSSTAGAIQANLATLPSQVGTGTLYFKAILQSTSMTPCTLNSVSVTGVW